MFDVAIGGAFRLGELRAIRWRDVDRDRRLIRVERAYSRGDVRSPKTAAGVRSVPLFASVDRALQQLAGRVRTTSSVATVRGLLMALLGDQRAVNASVRMPGWTW